ncbi:MAG TPA: response regulator [Gemmatimonadaceae bacterium]|nr:response regulator [Gemmatimonadaceae bacterium]
MADSTATILLVEDNEDNLVIYSTILRHAGFDVLEARDGEAGIATAKEAQPSLILMDVSIPIVDGWEATRRLKSDPATSHIPIIAITAHAMPSDRQIAMEAGCDGYIAKPAEPRTVLAIVKQQLGQTAVK